MDRLLERDIVIRIVSVALAVILWFQVMAEENPQEARTFRDIPVTVANLPEGVAVVAAPQPVTVVVEGPRSILGRLRPEDLGASVDLAQAQAGDVSLPVVLSLPDGVTLRSVVPDVARVSLDPITETQVPVEIVLTGTPHPDFVAQAARVEPTHILVRGASRRVGSVVRAVGTVNVAGAVADVGQIIPLRALDAGGKEIPGLTLQPDIVKVTVPVVALGSPVAARVEPVLEGNPAGRYWVDAVDVEPGTVELRAPAGGPPPPDVVRTRPVSIAGADRDVVVTVPLEVPEGTRRVTPAEVTVRVRVSFEVEAERTLEAVPVEVAGLGEGLRAQVRPETVRVTVRGRASVVNALDPQAVTAVLDATGLGPGEHLLAPVVTLERGAVALAVEPAEVECVIRR